MRIRRKGTEYANPLAKSDQLYPGINTDLAYTHSAPAMVVVTRVIRNRAVCRRIFRGVISICGYETGMPPSRFKVARLWALLGSNQRPADYESAALTI